MSKIKLDLKQFKHVKSDGKTTTLQHEQGHQLTLAHNALSPEAQEQLSQLAKSAQTPLQADSAKHQDMKMAEGGKLESLMVNEPKEIQRKASEQPKKKEMQPFRPPQSKINYVDKPGIQHKAEGGEICEACGGETHRKMYANAGEVTQDTSPPPALAADPDPAQQQAPAALTLQPPQTGNAADQAMQSAGINPAAPEPSKPKIDPKTKAIREQYNSIVNHETPAAIALGKDSDFPDPAASFGSDDQAPENFKPEAWNKAKTDVQEQKLQTDKVAVAAQSQRLQENAARQEAGLPPLPSLDAGSPSDGGLTPGSEPTPNQQPGVPFPGQTEGPESMDPTSGILGGIQKQREAANMQATALGEQGAANKLTEQNAASAEQEATTHFQHSYQELENERQAHMADIQNNLINPDKYWTGNPETGEGGHSKIMAGIGMILAGFSPTNSPNAAVNFLKYQMDKNIEGQRQNLGAKNNLLTANLHQFKNLQDATDMTRIMQNDATKHMLNAAAAKAQGPLAKAAALNVNGQLDKESAQLQFQMGIRKTMMRLSQGAGGDPANTAPAEQMVNMLYQYDPEKAKQFAGRIVPGVGISSSQVIDQDVRKELIGKKNFGQMAQHYVDWVKQNGGTVNLSKMTEGAAMAAELQGAYRNATHGGVFKEGEQNFINTLIPSDPSQFAGAIRTLPKVEELIRSNNAQFETLKQGNGIPSRQQQQPGAAKQIPEGTTGLYKGQPVIRQGGVWVPRK